MVKLVLQGLKIAVPKPKRSKTSDGIVRTGKKITRGKVFQDEDGTYKVAIDMKNDQHFPNLRILEFTERSYDLVGRTNVFSRNVDEKGRRIRFIRNPLIAKYFPGLPEQYIPFAPNWIVKGYIVNDQGRHKFDFKDLVGIDGYQMDISQDLEE